MKRLVSATALAMAAVAPVSAATITASIADYDSPPAATGFPIDRGIIGTFAYAVPLGATISAAFLEGTYGDAASAGGSTASFDASVDGNASFTVCAINSTSCYFQDPPFFARPFSIALSSASYASLLDGSATLRIVQTSDLIVRYGTPTLRIETSDVPEPATWAMMLGGFGAIGSALRRRKSEIVPNLA